MCGRHFTLVALAAIAALALAAPARADAVLGTYSLTGSMETFTVPSTGDYDITAWGAAGGANGLVVSNASLSAPGGRGAEMSGEFLLAQGQVLTLLVGGKGPTGTSNANAELGNEDPFGAGGGGGGSFVTIGGTVLLVAGGGGGAGFNGANYVVNYKAQDTPGFDALTGRDGGSTIVNNTSLTLITHPVSQVSTPGPYGGTNGGGGEDAFPAVSGVTAPPGGGGGGLAGNGLSQRGGKAFFSGGMGADPIYFSNNRGIVLAAGGGYGGGGGAGENSRLFGGPFTLQYGGGGGGGGYSGGAGGYGGSTTCNGFAFSPVNIEVQGCADPVDWGSEGGAGGGSYIADNATLLLADTGDLGNTGNGYIEIDAVAPVPEPASATLLVVGFAGATLARRRRFFAELLRRFLAFEAAARSHCVQRTD